MEPLKLVAVTAGLSVPSSTRLLADRIAEATARQLGAPGEEREPRETAVQVVELRELATDLAHHLVTGFPSAALREALDAVTDADAVIAVTPVFAASYSGLFKSFFDVLDQDALTGTPVLVAATGGTARHSLVLDQAMRPLFAYLRALVVPTGVFAASEDWGPGAAGGTDGLGRRIDRAAGELAGLLRGRVTGAPADDALVPFEQQLAAVRTA